MSPNDTRGAAYGNRLQTGMALRGSLSSDRSGIPPGFLETELRQIAPSSQSGQRRADKLAKVCLKSREYEFVLIHVELESNPEPDFDEQMCLYNHRRCDIE